MVREIRSNVENMQAINAIGVTPKSELNVCLTSDQIAQLVDGRLDKETERLLTAHLKDCFKCQKEIHKYIRNACTYS